MGQTTSKQDLSGYALKTDIPSTVDNAIKSKWADEGNVSGDVNIAGILKVGGTDISTKYAPATGSTKYAPATGSANYAPATGSANYAPATGSSVYAPATGSSVYAPSTGSANYAPATGSANYAPSTGSSVYASSSKWGNGGQVNTDVNINSNNLYLRKDDGFNYIKYSNTASDGSAGYDGVLISGAAGGRLNAGVNVNGAGGTINALKWDNTGNVSVTGKLSVAGTDVMTLVNSKANTADILTSNWGIIKPNTMDCSGTSCSTQNKSIVVGKQGMISFQDQYHNIHHEPSIDGMVVSGWNGGELRYKDSAGSALKWDGNGDVHTFKDLILSDGGIKPENNLPWLQMHGGTAGAAMWGNGLSIQGGLNIGNFNSPPPGGHLKISNWDIYEDNDGSLVFKNAEGRGARIWPNRDNRNDTNMYIGDVGGQNQRTNGNWAKN